MDRLYMSKENSNIRGCAWVEGTPDDDNMICMDEEYFEFLQKENAYYRLEDFLWSLPKPLQSIIKPFFDKFVKENDLL